MFMLVLSSIWLIGSWLRIKRQAQFYQIEEYMTGRYLRWLLASRSRWLPPRPLLAWLAGVAIAALPGIRASNSLAALVMGIAAVIAVWPPAQGEIKKPLVLTARLKRLLFWAGLLAFVSLIASLFLLDRAIGNLGTAAIIAGATLAMACFMLAPIWLVAGNLIAQPTEAVIRRRYLRQAAATLHRVNPKVIGITGSYGKTTTKTFLNDILSARYHSYATPKSYNTLMGISLAINRDLADDYRTEYFISEMGAYVEGEIARICQLTPPDIAIITEVGPQHLERFGSLENIKNAKYELVKNLPPDGLAVFNWDNPYIREMAALGYPANRLTVSRELSLDVARVKELDWIACDIEESLAGLAFRAIHVRSGESARINTSIIGAHNISNLLLCIALAHHEGVSLRDIATRIGSLRPAESRLVREITASGIAIINDAYSANPAGVVSALKILGMHETGRRLLITPGLVELGALQECENHKLGQLAARHATDIILVGKSQTAPIHAGILSTGFDRQRLRVVDALHEAVSWYERHLRAGDTVLFLNDLPDTY